MIRTRPILRARRLAGFTLPELLLGMAMTALTLGALAALMGAMAQQWKEEETSRSSRVAAYQASARIAEMLRGSRFVGWTGAYADGSGAACFIWFRDYPPQASMELAEIMLLEYQAPARQLVLWRLEPRAAAAALKCAKADIDEFKDIAPFKQLAGMRRFVLLNNVTSFSIAAFDISAGALRPRVEYSIATKNGGRNHAESQTVMLRCVQSP